MYQIIRSPNVGASVVGARVVGAAEATVRSARAAARIASDVMVFCGLRSETSYFPFSRLFSLHHKG